MKFIALVFSCLLSFSVAASANDADTFNAMLALANTGDAEAQYHVGMMYNNGIGTQKDPSQAFGWFEKSTAANDPLGAFKLGCYYAGQFAGVVKTDENKALKYKLIAATAGYSLAQHDVAAHYARQGNFEEAVKWLQLAAAQGYDSSLYALSRSYYVGKGVPRDYPLAFVYFKLGLMVSQSELNADAKAILDDMMANMSDAELANAQKVVLEWTPQPTALTTEAQNGIAAAEEHLQKMKK